MLYSGFFVTLTTMSSTLLTNAQLFRERRFAPGSLLIEDGRIAEVTDGDVHIHGAEVIDMAGQYVLPGFVDGHFHLMMLALKRLRCDLSRAVSAQQVVERLSDWSHRDSGAIVGVEWDESRWRDHTRPTRAMLDAISAERPVFARRICCHVGVANSALLDMLRARGDFVDADTGVITEAAVFEATRLTYPAQEGIVSGMEPAIRDLHALGVTGIHDIIDKSNYDAYLQGLRVSAVPLRIDGIMIAAPDELDGLKEQASDIGDDMLRIIGVKLFSDGSLGAHTAALNSPYSDAQTLGDFLLDESELHHTLSTCADRGITCAVHAIGDRAIRTVALEMAKFPRDVPRFRIEHAEVIGWDEMELLARAPVVLAMQPNFVRRWGEPGGLYEQRLGRSRWERCNPFRTLADGGVGYMFGSDGMPPGPLYGIAGATRHPVEKERLTVAEALERYTDWPNRLGAVPRPAGRLEAGNLADLVVLSGNPLAGDPDQIEVAGTWVGGGRVYGRPAVSS